MSDMCRNSLEMVQSGKSARPPGRFKAQKFSDVFLEAEICTYLCGMGMGRLLGQVRTQEWREVYEKTYIEGYNVTNTRA